MIFVSKGRSDSSNSDNRLVSFASADAAAAAL